MNGRRDAAGIIRTVAGERARFCDVRCMFRHRDDVRDGLPFENVRTVDGRLLSAAAGSVVCGHCASCGGGLDVPGAVRETCAECGFDGCHHTDPRGA